MAAKQLIFIFDWENKKVFEMRAAEPEALSYTSIVRVEENSNIGSIWGNIQEICESYIHGQISQIGAEMKQP
jgi:hypothetical protein